MERRIASPKIRTDRSARSLIELLDRVSRDPRLTDAVVYYDFPMFRDDEDDLLRSHVLFAAPTIGLLFFGLPSDLEHDAEARIASMDDSLGQLYALAFGRLVKNSRLRKDRNTLTFNLDTCIFCPALVAREARTESKLISSEQGLASFITSLIGERLSDETWNELIATLEGSNALRREKEKGLADAPKGTKAAILGEIYSRIASFDEDQRRAAIALVDGPQRIRGIAGSGKTVVLAMKAAHIHLNNPQANLLVTFWTKSLYDQFRFLITRFYRQFTDKDPDWTRVNILHAWGGRSTGGGVYYNACVRAGVPPMTLADIKRLGAKPSFDGACEELITKGRIESCYDYVLIDEGQDLPSSFYRLCFQVTRGGEIDRNVIWAYDELQTILDVQVQNVRETFGRRPDGQPLMDLSRAEEQLSEGLQPHDIVLKRSYRNPAEVLVVAHALGFGIYSNQIVQILENARHWEDLGYEVIEGACEPGVPVRIRRPKKNSPIDVASYENSGTILSAQTFDGYREEVEWVISECRNFLAEGLRPQDILFVSLDDRNAKKYFADISQALLASSIQVNNLSLPAFSVPNFHVEGSVTLSTVYKAKGNEAAVVFVLGVDAIALELDEVRARNRLFAALTRSKAWLRVSGVRPMASPLLEEIRTAIANIPDLVFVYPDPNTVRMIQRDIAERSIKLAKLQTVIEELGLTNLSPDEIAKLVGGEVVKKR
jgi:superfamily I DNA and RNA helicase